MSDYPDRPSTLPCSNCGASMPVSWASGHGVATCPDCGLDSYIFDPPLDLPDLAVALDSLMWPSAVGVGAAKGALGSLRPSRPWQRRFGVSP